jgi:transcription elongation GreA/GreB family factor
MTTADQVRARIEALQALPRTHKYVMTYADGRTRAVLAVSEAAAENGAVRERRHIGRDLIDRATGETVRIVSVEVKAI